MSSASSVWPLPGDPRDAHDLARVDGQVDAPDARAAEALDLDRPGPRLDRGPGGLGGRSRPTISRASSAASVSAAAQVARHEAVAQDRDAVRDGQHLVQLVADEDRRPARGAQLADDPEQPSGLLGRQDGGRLVEDQDAGAAVQRAQDLDSLEVARPTGRRHARRGSTRRS